MIRPRRAVRLRAVLPVLVGRLAVERRREGSSRGDVLVETSVTLGELAGSRREVTTHFLVTFSVAVSGSPVCLQVWDRLNHRSIGIGSLDRGPVAEPLKLRSRGVVEPQVRWPPGTVRLGHDPTKPSSAIIEGRLKFYGPSIPRSARSASRRGPSKFPQSVLSPVASRPCGPPEMNRHRAATTAVATSSSALGGPGAPRRRGRRPSWSGKRAAPATCRWHRASWWWSSWSPQGARRIATLRCSPCWLHNQPT